MSPARCEACGAQEDLPYTCKFCEGRFCGAHRLPENHECTGLGAYKERLRQEGRLMHQPGEPVRADVSRTARWGAKLDEALAGVWRLLEGRAAYTMLGIMGGVFLLQALALSLSPGLMELLFVLDGTFYLKPWTIVTSIFAHGGLQHLLVNGIVLFFFGPALESLIGSKRFTLLFLGTGVAAGLAHVLVFSYALPAAGILPASGRGVVGASGAIMGLLGTLTVLAPNITVYLMFILPLPLWLVTIGYALYDLADLFTPGGNVANLAHLAGLAIGLYYGWYLKDQGLRVRRQQRGRGGGGGGGVNWSQYVGRR